MKQARLKAASAILSPLKPSLSDRYSAWAPVNIALCKYWGKRNKELNLPVNDSLSISLGDKGTRTTLTTGADILTDNVMLNGQPVEASSEFYQRTISHMDLFRKVYGYQPFYVETTNTVSTAAGLASSASGFAALTMALAGIYGLNLSSEMLSVLARLGSGSACRSIFSGFVLWQKGQLEDGSDSYATPLPDTWPSLRIGILNISTTKKSISSRDGMQRTCDSSPFFSAWTAKAEQDIVQIKTALNKRDIQRLGITCEHNAMSMHATMLSSWPPLFYWSPETTKIAHNIWKLREDGITVYFTMDAGPNIKLIFEQKDEAVIKEFFPETDIVQPFKDRSSS